MNSGVRTFLSRYRSSNVLRKAEPDLPPRPEYHGTAVRSDERKPSSPPLQKRSRRAANGAG